MVEPLAPIVASKIRPPVALRDGVRRDRLRARLVAAFDGGASVGLLCAPAGSGKTTLLRSLVEEHVPEQVAWVGVDSYDNEPARFWAHVIAGLEASVNAGGAVSVAATRSGDWAAVVQGVLASLEQGGERWLILDDYQEITSPVIHDHVDLLLRWLPSTSRVLVASRTDPPLPMVSRLRLDDRLAELRAGDLAFDVEDAGQLLEAASRREVGPEATAELVARTEGWAAGLHLAALSIRRSGDPSIVVERFAGDDRLVADYLRAEFLSHLDEDTKEFLVRTSVLDELTGESCDEVAATSGSAARLRELERANLLLIPLDESGHRYRNHHLVTNWLRSELALTEPNLVAELHRRAARWFVEAGVPEPAHRHAVASHDRSLVVEVTERFWHDLLMSGRYVTLRAWLDELGPAAENSASLCLGRAQLARNTGEPPETAARWLQLATDRVDGADTETVVLLHTNLVVHERMVGDLGAAERHGRAALAAVANPALVAEVRSLLGATLAQLGSFDEAIDHLEAALGIAGPRSDRLTGMFARAQLPLPLYESGQRQRAWEAALDAMTWAEEADLSGSPMLGTAQTVLGHLCLDEGHTDEAKEHLDAALTASARSKAATSRLHALLGLARHAAATKHTIDAKRFLAEARRLTENMPDPGRLAPLVEISARQYLGSAPSEAGQPLVEDLTERELAVLRLLPSELSLRGIGGELYISHNTIKGHVKAIYRKLAVNSRDGAVARSRELGLL
jgi:LuxR family maltose regulon positive regulatory protein